MIQVITTHYNPCGYEALRRNWERYASRITAQGARLLTVQVILGDEPTLDPVEPCGEIVTVGCRDVLWHKEDAINLAVSRYLPVDCEHVAWIDGDILLGDGVLEHASQILRHYPVCQLFDTFEWLGPDGARQRKTATWTGGGPVLSGRAHGGAWAARREILERHGLYDRAIAGGGDTCFALACTGEIHMLKERGFCRTVQQHWRAWAERLHDETRGRISHVPGTATHLYHGSIGRRQYRARHYKLDRLGYDPRHHVHTGDSGLLEWTQKARPELRDYLLKFFSRRRDDD